MTSKYNELVKLHSEKNKKLNTFKYKSENIFNYFLGGLSTFLDCEKKYIRPTNKDDTIKFTSNLLNPIKPEMGSISDLMYFDGYDESWNLEVLINIQGAMSNELLIFPIKIIEIENGNFTFGFKDSNKKFDIDLNKIDELNYFDNIYNFIFETIISISSKSKFKIGFQIENK